MTRIKRTATALGALAGVAALLVLPACSGGDDSDDTASVASLGDLSTETTAASTDSSTASEADLQQAMLDYAQCMRDHGIDMADPQFEEGGVVIHDAEEGEPTAQDQAEFDAADAECSPTLEEARANMPAPSPEEQAELREQSLAFAECMRDHAVEDFPDPLPDEGGGMKQEVSEDIESDPEFDDTQTACQDEIWPSEDSGTTP